MKAGLKILGELFLVRTAFCAGLLWLLPVGMLRAETNVLVPSGSFWRYLDDGSDQGVAWRARGFDDSAWQAGFAQLGYGDGDEETALSYGPFLNNKFITYYFRIAFPITRASSYTNLSLAVLRDDGVVAYLNGVEVFRNNMPDGPIDYRSLASTNVTIGSESVFYQTNLPAWPLVNGTNVLAVEIHQVRTNSADLSFDAELIGAFEPPVVPAITRGPYLQQATPTGIIIRWRSNVPLDTEVRLADGAGERVISDQTLTTEHEVHVTGLLPYTSYAYSVGTTEMVMADDFSFKTSPTNSQPTCIWVIGDAGTRGDRQRAVYNAFRYHYNYSADLWLLLGDNAYPSGSDSDHQAALFDMYPELLRTAPAWPTIGNHDASGASAVDFPYLHIFNLPRNGEAGGVASGTERYYSFDYGSIHFVCLDAWTSDRSSNGPMCSWLREDLAANSKDWLIAYWHHPPYSKGHHDSDLERELIEMRENVVPILESYGVDIVLSGHSHCYERSFFINGHYGHSSTFQQSMKLNGGGGRPNADGPYLKPFTGPRANQGAVYVVAGSSGQVTPGSINHPAMYFSELELGSLLIKIDGPWLEARFLREAESEDDPVRIDDSFSIYKGPPLPERPTVRVVGIEDGQLTLSWETRLGLYYLVERANDLSAQDWEPVTLGQQSNGEAMSATVPSNAGGTAGFYRVREFVD